MKKSQLYNEHIEEDDEDEEEEDDDENDIIDLDQEVYSNVPDRKGVKTQSTLKKTIDSKKNDYSNISPSRKISAKLNKQNNQFKPSSSSLNKMDITSKSRKEESKKEERQNTVNQSLQQGGNIKDIDVESVSREELVNILLYSDQTPIKEATSSKKINADSANVSRSIKVAKTVREINLKESDPEIKNNDFNVAYSNVVNNMMSNTTNKGDNPEVMRLLLSGDNDQEEINKVICYIS